MSTSVSLEGANAFQKDINVATGDLDNLAGPMSATASSILSAARPATPRVTGALAGSLTPSSAKREAVVSSSLEYANPVHWGWRAHNIEPQPFLTTAARRTEAVWIGHFERHVDKTLSRMDKKYA